MVILCAIIVCWSVAECAVAVYAGCNKQVCTVIGSLALKVKALSCWRVIVHTGATVAIISTCV